MKNFTIYIVLLILVTSCGESVENEDSADELAESHEITDASDDYSEFLSVVDIDNWGDEEHGLIPTDEFEAFKEQLTTIELDGVKYYVVEGDLLMTEEELLMYFTFGGELNIEEESIKMVVASRQGKYIRMPDQLNIKFAIVKRTFLNEEDYDSVKHWINEAAKDWEGLCNVKFDYLELKDTILRDYRRPNDLTFIVAETRHDSDYIATAFFPNSNPKKWRIIIGPKFYTVDRNKIGLFRHEIGHTLGFRHEHIRRNWLPNPCEDAPPHYDQTSTDLTVYDSMSVMHYVCGDGYGSKELLFTTNDSLGALKVYPFEH